MARQRCDAAVCSSTSLSCLSTPRAGYATDLTDRLSVSRLKQVPAGAPDQAKLQPPRRAVVVVGAAAWTCPRVMAQGRDKVNNGIALQR